MYPLVTNCTSNTGTLQEANRFGCLRRAWIGIPAFMGLALFCSMTTGCAAESQPAPVIQKLCTAKNSNSCVSWVYAGESIPVRIEGENLLETWEVDLGKDSPPKPVGKFRAWIGPAELVDLQKLSFDSNSGWDILQGTLPGTLDLGFYSARIETPSSATASFFGPVEVRTPLFLSVSAEKLHAPVHDTIRMIVNVENKSTSALGDVSIELTQGGTGSVYIPDAPAVFSLDGQSSLDITFDLQGASPGQPQIQVKAKALTGAGLELGEAEAQIVTMDILEAASVDMDFSADPQQLTMDQELTLVATVQNTGGVAIEDTTMVIKNMQGTGQLQWSPSGASRRIEPGEQSVFTLKATAVGAGNVEIYPVITGTEAISQRPLEFAAISPLYIEITQ